MGNGSRDNYIACNHIYNLGKRVLYDIGGVYLLGAQPEIYCLFNGVKTLAFRRNL